jgi:hypothetical protein
LEIWRLRPAAIKKQQLLNPEGVAKGVWLMDALLNRKNVCKRCHAIYTPKEYEFAERFMVRSILRVQDSLPDPMLCDFCFHSIQQEVNPKWTNVGTSNAGPPNLALKHLIAKE